MLKRLILLAVLAVVIAAAYVGWLLLAPGTRFTEKEKALYIYPDATDKASILKMLVAEEFTNRPRLVDLLAERKEYWQNPKPGRYLIPKGISALQLVNLLQAGVQSPTNLVIGKLRTLPDLAKVMSRYIAADSATIMAEIGTPEALKKYGLSLDTWMTAIIPNTYSVLWTQQPKTILRRLITEKEKWWAKNGRADSAKARGLTPDEVQIIASIVEEETNKQDDRPKVASVYLNRLRIGMPLQADPTVRYALKDFKSNRVTYAQLRTPSPYNTYVNRGLPPGPICTPGTKSIEAVLQSSKTDYIFFVAHSDLRGGSIFTTNLADHNRAARLYQDSLNAWLKRKELKEKLAASRETDPPRP